MKRINPRAALISLFLGLAGVAPAQAQDYYYIYRDPDGKLAISNKEPPPGSKIIRQHSWTEVPEKQVQQGQEHGEPQPNVQPDGETKPSKTK